MSYVIALKRNTAEVCASELGVWSNFGGVFSYNECSVLVYEPLKSGYRVLVFCDEELGARELGDFLVCLEK